MSRYYDVWLDGVKLDKVVSITNYDGYGTATIADVDEHGKEQLTSDNTLLTKELSGYIITNEIK